MDDMEVEAMELDSEMEVDQGRRQRAAQKLANRFAPAPTKQQDTMDDAKARDILKRLAEMSCGNKINVDNAFDLKGIDALRTIVFSDSAKASALCGEGHFQNAGAGLDIGIKIYGKRVDATYNLAYSLGNFSKDARKGDDADADDQDEGHQGGGMQADGAAGEEGAVRAPKAKKRQGPTSGESTLADDNELRQRVKEPTFDTDPFFVRTSRLIDENSPQGLLLHNLPVFCGTDVAFDATARPQVLLEAARKKGLSTVAQPADDVMVDFAVLAGALECLRAAASAPISPGIERLYELLQSQPDLPGLAVVSKVDPERLLVDALAANERARLEAHRNKTVRQAVRQVEDAMDVDMGDARNGGGGQDDAGAGPVCDDGAGSHLDAYDGGGGEGGGDGDAAYGGYYSPGYNAGDDGDGDDGPLDSVGGTGHGSNLREGGVCGQRSTHTHAAEEAGGAGDADPVGSDDESALLSLLSGRANSASTLQQNWWRPRLSRAKKAAPADGAKTRARKPKPEPEAVDFRSSPRDTLTEAVSLHVYKTTRRDASAKLCLPLEEPQLPAVKWTYFAAVAATGYHNCPGAGAGTGIVGVLGAATRMGGGRYGGPLCSSQEHWRAVLMSDLQKERQLRRGGARAAALRKSLGASVAAAGTGTGTGTPRGQRLVGLTASGTGGGPDGGEEYGTAAQDAYPGGDAGGGFDDAGPLDDGAGGSYGGFDDDADEEEEEEEAGGGGSRAMPQATTLDGRFPTLEELLQPPRRVRRLAVKYDKTAGVADVATLKANIEVSLKELAVMVASQRRQSTAARHHQQQPTEPALSFQRVLDQVSAHAAAGDAVAAPRTGAGARPLSCGTGTAASGSAPGSAPPTFLCGVSPHLAFICLLHLANEKGLALRNSDTLDSLIITELGDLAGGPAAAH